MTVVQDIPNFSPKTIRNLTSSFNNIVPFDKLGRKKYLNFDDILALLESPKESGRPSNVINTVSDFLQIVREDCDEYVVSEILYRVTKNLDHEFLIEHMMLVLSKGEFNIQSLYGLVVLHHLLMILLVLLDTQDTSVDIK